MPVTYEHILLRTFTESRLTVYLSHRAPAQHVQDPIPLPALHVYTLSQESQGHGVDLQHNQKPTDKGENIRKVEHIFCPQHEFSVYFQNISQKTTLFKLSLTYVKTFIYFCFPQRRRIYLYLLQIPPQILCMSQKAFHIRTFLQFMHT